MPYIKLHPIKQLDFQINRILTYGDEACDFEEVKSAAKGISDLDSWYKVWRSLGEKAEIENRHLHAAYYYRLAEFFLNECSDKDLMYKKSIENFNKIISLNRSLRIEYVPYQNAAMKTFVFSAENPIGNLVVFGGYDSFIEEFYLAIKKFAEMGYNIYLFEGPGQGETLKKGLTFEPHWEKPLGAVLDYFDLNDVCVIGISWGGYLALRSAAFEQRISKVVAYDVLYDGFDCMTNPFPSPMKSLVKFLFGLKAKTFINAFVKSLMEKRLIIDWAVSHGQYITGTKTPYDFYTHLKEHTLNGIMDKIKCDVLLLAGEHDHYIPDSHYDILMNGITKAKSLCGKKFTEAEGGAEHCQIGNHQLATDYIIGWLNKN
ncbi:MAG TPA: alpha/beta hydrolase [Firmicutes bacterium]|nr:alpha/beta hydrolase [Bacillota bacterium]